MIVAGVMVLDAVGEVVVRMGHVVVMMVSVLVLPSNLLGIAYNRSVEMLERVRASVCRYPCVEEHPQGQDGRDQLPGTFNSYDPRVGVKYRGMINEIHSE